MSFKESKHVLIGTGAVLLGWWIFHMFWVAPAWSDYEKEKAAHVSIDKEARRKYLTRGRLIKEVEAAAEEEAEAVRAGIATLSSVNFEVDSKFSSEGKMLIDFQQELNKVNGIAASQNLVSNSADVQLGFTKSFQDSEPVDALFRRLAVLDRIVRAATPRDERQKIKKIVSVGHPEIRIEGQEGVDRHVVKVPVEIELEADEVSLIHLLHSLLKTPKKGASYVGLERIEIRVEKPESGAFNCRLSLFGMFIREGEAESEDEDGTSGGRGRSGRPPIPRY